MTRPALTALTDEPDLVWFFSIGQSAFERSTFGDMLKRAEELGTTSDGERLPPAGAKERAAWDYAQARTDRPRLATSLPQELVDAIRDAYDWTGNDPALTVRPRAEKHGTEPGYTPDHAALVRYAEVSRALMRVTPEHRRALELFFGLRGNFWASRTAGRVAVLYPETDAGKRLLATFPGEGRVDQRIVDQAHEQRRWPDVKRGLWLVRAEQQALRLIVAAKKAYRKVTE